MNFKSATMNAQTAAANSGFSFGKGCLIFFVVLGILWLGSWAVGASLWDWAFGDGSPSEIAQTVERQPETLIRISTPYGEFPFIVEDQGKDGLLLTGNDGVQMRCETAGDTSTCQPVINATGATLSSNVFVLPDKLDSCLDGLGGTTCQMTGKPRAVSSYK